MKFLIPKLNNGLFANYFVLSTNYNTKIIKKEKKILIYKKGIGKQKAYKNKFKKKKEIIKRV